MAIHETFAYGQSSYDGDACRTCGWQGPRNSAENHVTNNMTQAERDEREITRMIATLDTLVKQMSGEELEAFKQRIIKRYGLLKDS